jgi:bile acid:Na+ symporter, BASS family
MFDFYPAYEHLFAQIQLTLFMIAMGTNLAPADFVEIVRRPRSFLLALFMQLIVIPAVVVAINHLAGLEPGIAVGLLLTAAMPGGALSKFFTYLARGNAALSISLSVVLTLGTLVTVPAMLLLLAREYMPSDFSLPVGRIIVEVAAFSLVPLAIGLLLGRKLPRQSPAIARWCVRVGLVVIVAMVVCSLGSGRITPSAYGWKAPIAIIVFCILSMQLSMAPFRLLRWPWKDTVAVGIEATMRNMNLALLLKASIFVQDDDAGIGSGVLFVVLYYAAVAMIAGLPLVLHFRLKARWGRLANTAPSSVE